MYVVDGIYIREFGIMLEFITEVVKKLKCKCGWGVFKKRGQGG